jgi:hypothetical protein
MRASLDWRRERRAANVAAGDYVFRAGGASVRIAFQALPTLRRIFENR